jgi:hypothetical protein
MMTRHIKHVTKPGAAVGERMLIMIQFMIDILTAVDALLARKAEA